MRWPLVFYTDKLLPSGSAGVMRIFLLPCIFIRPTYRGDEGLLAHELAHVRQAWRRLLVPHSLLYLFSDDYRLTCEVEAYREQLRVNRLANFKGGKDYAAMYAGFIANDYKLTIPEHAALEMLRDA